MIENMLLAGLLVLGLGGVISGVRRNPSTGLIVQALGSALIGVAGLGVLLSDRLIGATFTNSLHPSFGVDQLSGFFLAMVGLVATPTLVFSTSYLSAIPRGRSISALTAMFLGTLALVICARDPATFLTGWELMTVLPAGVILVARGCDPIARKTVFTYLAVTHVGGVGTWIAMLTLAKHGMIGGSVSPGTGSAVQLCIAVAALIGMGTKAGVMPMHVWLPRAHPVAPAPISALMSGVMIKVAIYALIRVLVEWVGVLPTWFGILVLAVGALSAIGGVTYAIFQHELKRLLALHSIENIGIIVLGIGACLILRAHHADTWAAFALAAALLHTINHAIFKALLFLGAGAFDKAVGSVKLDQLGGLLRQMPATGAAFLIASMAIAGLPPLNGFVSEWSTMQALLQVTSHGGRVGGVAGALALAVLASTAALALLCFAKVVGLTLLGPPRYEQSETTPVTEAPWPMVAGMLTLAAGCLVLGLAPGMLFGRLTQLAVWSSDTAPTGLGLDLPGTGSLPTVGLGIVLIAVTTVLVRARGRTSAAPAPTWVCGQRVEPALQWTGAGFTKLLRLSFQVFLRPQREIVTCREHGVLKKITYQGHISQLIDDYLYRPVVRWSTPVAASIRKIQTGNISVYVTYLMGLLLALLGAARIGLFG